MRLDGVQKKKKKPWRRGEDGFMIYQDPRPLGHRRPDQDWAPAGNDRHSFPSCGNYTVMGQHLESKKSKGPSSVREDVRIHNQRYIPVQEKIGRSSSGQATDLQGEGRGGVPGPGRWGIGNAVATICSLSRPSLTWGEWRIPWGLCLACLHTDIMLDVASIDQADAS